MKLSTRIALSVGAVVPLMVLASGALLLRLVAGDLRAQQDARLHDRAAVVAEDARRLLRVTAAGRPPVVEQARQRSLFASALDIGIRLTGPEGTASGGPQPPTAVRLPDSAPVPVTVRGAGESWRVLSVPLNVPRHRVTGTLWLLAPDTASRTQVTLVRRRVFATALFAAPLSGLLAWAVATRAARPLRLLQQRTSGLDPRATTTRLEHTPTRIAEVDDLAATLRTVLARYDEQAARTAEALETARSFSAAASHELRTPLMSMQTNLEVLAEHPDLGAQDRVEVLADLRHEHARLLGLLVMLRELGRGDLVEAEAFGPVDLADVVDASAEDLRRRHPRARIDVRTAQGPQVHGWEPGLRTVVDNLLANALLHGRTGEQPARVAVTLRAGGRPGSAEAVLTVDDRGPGIPAQRRDSVFERFHRGPDSPGSGLGLTLVAQQVALHRGTIRVMEPPGGPGTRIEVRIPAPSATEAAESAATTLPLRRDWMAAAARPHDFHKDGF